MCHIRGTMQKREYVNLHDIVLVAQRSYQDAKADVLARYSPDEARMLRACGELPDAVRLDAGAGDAGDALADDAVEFTDDVAEIDLQDL